MNFNCINFYIVFNIKITLLSDKNCKILCLLFTIIIIGLLIRAFINQGKLWGNENFTVSNPCSTICLIGENACKDCKAHLSS